jgi:hypothetical protein
MRAHRHLTETIHPRRRMPVVGRTRMMAGRGTPRDDREAHRMGWWFGGFIALIIWIAIAFWPARVAARKGHSFFLFFLLSLVFFPASLILAYVVRDRRRVAY